MNTTGCSNQFACNITDPFVEALRSGSQGSGQPRPDLPAQGAVRSNHVLLYPKPEIGKRRPSLLIPEEEVMRLAKGAEQCRSRFANGDGAINGGSASTRDADAAFLITSMGPPKLSLASRIHTIRGQKVMLGPDLAALYGVPTKSLVQAVKRNLDRFPADFAFQLTEQER